MALEYDPFKYISIEQRDIFLNMLENNNISYDVLTIPVDNINGFYCVAKTVNYKNFKDFIDELNETCVVNIYLHKISIIEDTTTGELFYRIRYCINKDIIENDVLEEIKRIFNSIEFNKNEMTTNKMKTKLKTFDISDNAITNFIKLIKIIEKELKKDKND